MQDRMRHDEQDDEVFYLRVLCYLAYHAARDPAYPVLGFDKVNLLTLGRQCHTISSSIKRLIPCKSTTLSLTDSCAM